MLVTGLRCERRRDGANRFGGIDDIVPSTRSCRSLRVNFERHDWGYEAEDTESSLYEFRSGSRKYSALLVAGEYEYEPQAADRMSVLALSLEAVEI